VIEESAMQIDEIMTKAVRVIAPELDAERAWQTMRTARVRHLVVMDGDQAIGILSERDLGGTRGAAVRKGQRVRDLMTTDVVAVAPDENLRRAANLLRGHVIGCLPVIDGKKLVGIVTTTDLLDLIGRGAERPAGQSVRWVLRARGPRQAATKRAKAKADRFGR
jgi:CBS domain-containing protein